MLWIPVYVLLFVSPMALGLISDLPCFEPCNCPPSYDATPRVNCSHLGLRQIPSFKTEFDPFSIYPYNQKFAERHINLDGNYITEIPANAFSELATMYPGDNLTINLAHNEITSVHADAFNGLVNPSVTLDLKSNHILTLPEALRAINNLVYLDISLNPLTEVSEGLLTHLAPALKTLYITVESLPSQAIVEGVLQLLQTTSLLIDGLMHQESLLRAVADAYKNNLEELSIRFPEALTTARIIPCRFPNLKRLNLDGSFVLVADLFTGCDTVQHLALQKLEIVNSDMKSIIIDGYKDVTFLSFGGNQLDAVPICVRENFKKLEHLNLRDNTIGAITDVDFQGLTSLSYLNLRNNPIETIAATAFSTNNISTLNLVGTMLTTISDAITGLGPAVNLRLPLDNIRCTCDSMANLKDWYTTRQQIGNVQCLHGETDLYDYITRDLQQCPSN